MRAEKRCRRWSSVVVLDVQSLPLSGGPDGLTKLHRCVIEPWGAKARSSWGIVKNQLCCADRRSEKRGLRRDGPVAVPDCLRT